MKILAWTSEQRTLWRMSSDQNLDLQPHHYVAHGQRHGHH